MRILVCCACLLALAASSFGQFDADAFPGFLRAKYGPPLRREIFQVQPDVQMVVDYAANGHVCSIQLPPIARTGNTNVSGPRGVDYLVDQLVPLAMRGKEVGRQVVAVGLPSVSVVMYEHIAIAENLQGSKRTGVTITFTGETCDQPPARQ